MCAVPTVGSGQCRVSDPNVGDSQPFFPRAFCQPSQTEFTHRELTACQRKTISLGGGKHIF